MTTLVMLEAKVKAEAVETMRALMVAAFPDTRAFAGCQGITAYVSQHDPQTFVFVETWASRSDYERYLAWRTETGSLAQLISLLAEPPVIRYFDPVPA